MYSIRDFICPLCARLMSEPKQLSCSHTFCMECLRQYLACSPGNAGKNSLKCPSCQTTTAVRDGHVDNLNTDDAVKSICNDLRNDTVLCVLCEWKRGAIYFCCGCGDFMCSDCLRDRIHPNKCYYLEREVVRVEDIREGKVVLQKKVYCQEHKSDGQEHVCTDVCLTCQKFICSRSKMLHLEEKGHIVRDAEEYNTSMKTEIESLQAQAQKKASIIKRHSTYVDSQVERVTRHIEEEKDKINQIHQRKVKILNVKKEELHKQLDDEKAKFFKRLWEVKAEDERFVTSIESTSMLAGYSLKIPLVGDTVALRDSRSGELKKLIDRRDPEENIASDVAECAKLLTFIESNQHDELSIGKVVKCKLKCEVKLSDKETVSEMVAAPDGIMAVGYDTGGITMFSADGQPQKTVLKDVEISGIGFLCDGRYVVLNTKNNIGLYTTELEKLDVKFETVRNDKDFGNLTVGSDDQIYVSYREAKKIQVFSAAGGKALREFPCTGYIPTQITSFNDYLIVRDHDNVMKIVDEKNKLKHKIKKPTDTSVHAAVTEDKSVLVASVRRNEKRLVNIGEYNNKFTLISSLISDYNIENYGRTWYYIQQFRSGEIAFCTPDKLYIFHKIQHLVIK